MSVCANCDALITCGCQRRTATDGTPVCTNCLAAYEQELIQKQSVNIANTDPILPGDIEWAYKQIDK